MFKCILTLDRQCAFTVRPDGPLLAGPAGVVGAPEGVLASQHPGISLQDCPCVCQYQW